MSPNCHPSSLFPKTLLILFTLTAAAAMFAPSAFAAGKAARIVILGTDDQLYVCAGDCAKVECLTCPVKGLQVRARAGIRPVSMNAQFDMPDMPPSQAGAGSAARAGHQIWLADVLARWQQAGVFVDRP